MLVLNENTARWENPDLAPRGQRLRLLAAGDYCPATRRRYDDLMSQGPAGAREVIAGLLDELAARDLSVVNLELPLVLAGEPIVKDGPNLQGPPAAIEGVLAGGFDVVNLANNHVLDFGPEPLLGTIDLARQRHLAVVGAGANLVEAAQPLLLDRNGLRIGILAVAENEFSSAQRSSPGAAPLQPGPAAVQIGLLRSRCDLLIVLVHGGSEMCPLPSPRMVRDYRSFIDAGADAVIGNHAHTAQPIEIYNGQPIAYNLGNWVFHHEAGPDDLWWKGIMLRLAFAGREVASIDVMPLKTDHDTGKVGLLSGVERAGAVGRLNRLGEIIADADLHERFWNAYSLTRLGFYRGRLKETLGGLDLPECRARAAAELMNMFTCEAHHDVITAALELVRTGRDQDSFGVEDELRELMGSLSH